MTGSTEENEQLINEVTNDAIDDLSFSILNEAEKLRMACVTSDDKYFNKSLISKLLNRIKEMCDELEHHI